MKNKKQKFISSILALCIFMSVLSATSVGAATVASDDEAVGATVASDDEAVGATLTYGNFKYTITDDSYAEICDYTGKVGKNVVLQFPSTIDDYVVKYINGVTITDPLKSVIIPDTVTKIYRSHFTLVESVYLGKNVRTTNECFHFYDYIYIPKTVTDLPSSDAPCKALYYEGNSEDINKINVDTSTDFYKFLQGTLETEAQIYYNCTTVPAAGQPKIVSNGFNLELTSKNDLAYVGEIPLEAGTYELKLELPDGFNTMNGNNVCGYDKTVDDSTAGGLTLSTRYKLPIKLNATGGIYKFMYFKDSKALIIRRIGELPDVYTVGDVHLTFEHIEGTSYYVANNISVPNRAFDYNFKICNKGEIFGGTQSLTNYWRETPFLYRETQTLRSKGYNLVFPSYDRHEDEYLWMYTYSFVFNSETNVLTGGRDKCWTSTNQTLKIYGDVAQSGGSMKNGSYTMNLDEGVYFFKMYDGYKILGGNYTIYDTGYGKPLNTNYKSSIMLIASGGTYKFTYNKSNKTITVQKQ